VELAPAAATLAADVATAADVVDVVDVVDPWRSLTAAELVVAR
jgi:hypothetical protein